MTLVMTILLSLLVAAGCVTSVFGVLEAGRFGLRPWRRPGTPFEPCSSLWQWWTSCVGVAAVALVASCFLFPTASRIYTSPDGRRSLRLATYQTVKWSQVRLAATLTDAETGAVRGRISNRVRERFLRDWQKPDAVAGRIDVEWLEEDPDSVRIVIADMDYACYLPSGRELHHVPPD